MKKDGGDFHAPGEIASVPIGRFWIGVRETPGHTPEGTTYLIPAGDDPAQGAAFVGDALFAGSIGRAQSPAAYPVLLHSVRDQLLSLPEDTRLFPGHGPVTTVAEERAHNPFFGFKD